MDNAQIKNQLKSLLVKARQGDDFLSIISYLLKESQSETRLRAKQLVKLSREKSVVDDLIEIALEMGQLMFYIQENEAEYHGLYLEAHNNRNNAEKRIFLELSKTTSDMKAKAKSVLEVSEIKNLESQFEVDYNDVKGFRYTLQDYKEGVQQKIAHLRKEAEIESMRQH